MNNLKTWLSPYYLILISTLSCLTYQKLGFALIFEEKNFEFKIIVEVSIV